MIPVRTGRLQRRLSWAAFAVMPLFLGIWVPNDAAMMLARNGWLNFRANNVARFYEQWSAAAQITPWNPYYDFETGVQLSQFVDYLNQQQLPDESSQSPTEAQAERERREDLLTKAAQHLERAANTVPTDELLNRYAGSLLAEISPVDGIGYLRRAAQLTPRKSYTYAMMGLAHGDIDPTDPLMVGSLAIEAYINPGFALTDVWLQETYSPYWTTTIEQSLQLYSRCLEAISNSAFERQKLYRNQVALQWVLAQLQEQAMDWTTVELNALSPIWQAIAWIDTGDPQQALATLEGDTSQAAALLRAWINPQRYLTTLQGGARPQGRLGGRLNELIQSIQERRQLLDWFLSMHDVAKAESSRIGFFSYRNMNGPDFIKFPYPLPYNLIVQALDLFEEMGYLPEFDTILVQAQAELLQLNRPLD
jgi:hypothetical protein